MTRLGVARALVANRLIDGDVAVGDGCILATGLAGPGRGTAAPGFVDLQVNGFAGVDFLQADSAGYAIAGEALARTGVTAYLPTFVTGDPAVTLAALSTLAEVRAAGVAGPRLLGAHLEGPFLSRARAGTHPASWLQEPSVAAIDRYLTAGPVGMVTLAPELKGGLDVIGHLVRAGVVVACGHTDADAATSQAAFDAGARAVTHCFNAMRPFSHRDPGIAGVALSRPGVTVPLIVDGVHLAREAVLLAWSAAHDRIALVTDAVAAAGMPDGRYRLGEVDVTKHGLQVRRADGVLAGSALTMDAAVRNAVELGVPLAAALHAASTVPARLVDPAGSLHSAGPAGRPVLGELTAGADADVVVLSDDLEVVRVLKAGQEIA